jgi:indolepyruvate ferredoxin oxidoreductase alpha subunit
MAERSFKEEVEKLKLGAGAEFRGEGILAITKALLESGVSYVAGYQGAPISHLMDVLADANDILESLGVHFENSASEATAAATLAASVNYPLRGAVTFKSVIGVSMASDALSILPQAASPAARWSSSAKTMAKAPRSCRGVPVRDEVADLAADPRPNLPCIVNAVKRGFELSGPPTRR